MIKIINNFNVSLRCFSPLLEFYIGIELHNNTNRKDVFELLRFHIISQSNRLLIISQAMQETYPGIIVFELVRPLDTKRGGRNVSRFTVVAMKSVSLRHNFIPGVSRGRNLRLFNEREGAKIAGRSRQTMTTACTGSSVRVLRRFLSSQPGIEMQIESSRSAGRNYDSRAWGNGGASRARELLFYRDGAREGAGEEWPRGGGEREGRGRKLINSNHRAPIPRRAKDRSARLRLTASATISFVIQGEKPRAKSHVRAHGMATVRDLPRRRFSGVSIGRMYTVSSVKIALRGN